MRRQREDDGPPAAECDSEKGGFYPKRLCAEIECVYNPIQAVSKSSLMVLTLLLIGANVFIGRKPKAAIPH